MDGMYFDLRPFVQLTCRQAPELFEYEDDSEDGSSPTTVVGRNTKTDIYALGMVRGYKRVRYGLISHRFIPDNARML